jgi:hypothetical protein
VSINERSVSSSGRLSIEVTELSLSIAELFLQGIALYVKWQSWSLLMAELSLLEQSCVY